MRKNLFFNIEAKPKGHRVFFQTLLEKKRNTKKLKATHLPDEPFKF